MILVRRFGPSWRAKTTVEIATDSRLLRELGPEQSERLVMFLKDADHAKFAESDDLPPTAGAHSLDDWEPWVSDFLAAEAGEARGTTGESPSRTRGQGEGR